MQQTGKKRKMMCQKPKPKWTKENERNIIFCRQHISLFIETENPTQCLLELPNSIKNWTKIQYIKVSREGFTGVFVEWSEGKLYNYTILLRKEIILRRQEAFCISKLTLWTHKSWNELIYNCYKDRKSNLKE